MTDARMSDEEFEALIVVRRLCSRKKGGGTAEARLNQEARRAREAEIRLREDYERLLAQRDNEYVAAVQLRRELDAATLNAARRDESAASLRRATLELDDTRVRLELARQNAGSLLGQLDRAKAERNSALADLDAASKSFLSAQGQRDAALARVANLEAERMKLREALGPFAEISREWYADGASRVDVPTVLLQRAAEVLE